MSDYKDYIYTGFACAYCGEKLVKNRPEYSAYCKNDECKNAYVSVVTPLKDWQLPPHMTEDKASTKQEGGSHYKGMTIQPSEFCQKNGIAWCEANVIKYVCRHKRKNGAEDIRKAIHYLNLLLEWEYGGENV